MSITDELSERIRASFIGLSGSGREQLAPRLLLNYGLSFGAFYLNRDVKGFDTEVSFEGNSFGAEGEFSLDYFLTENFAFGIGGAIHIAPFKDITKQRVTVKSFDFNRVDLFGGFRAYF
jgi:hypothetical protein